MTTIAERGSDFLVQFEMMITSVHVMRIKLNPPRLTPRRGTLFVKFRRCPNEPILRF